MLVKTISRTLLSKNATEIDKLIEAGYKLVVKKKGKVVFTINPPIIERKEVIEKDLTYLLEDETLFTKTEIPNHDPFNYSHLPTTETDDTIPAVGLGYRES